MADRSAAGPRRRLRKRRATVNVHMGQADRARLDAWARDRGVGASTLAGAVLRDGLDRMTNETQPDWRVLLAAETGTHEQRRRAPHLRLETLLRLIGPVRTARLLAAYGNSRLPSALTFGRQLRRAAILSHWERERWSHPRYLARLGGMFGMSAGQVRRIIGQRYWTKRRASYARRRGELREREEAAGVVVRTPTGRLSIKRLV